MPQAGGLNSGNVFSCSSKGWKPKTEMLLGLGLGENFWLRMTSFCFLCPHVDSSPCPWRQRDFCFLLLFYEDARFLRLGPHAHGFL